MRRVVSISVVFDGGAHLAIRPVADALIISHLPHPLFPVPRYPHSRHPLLLDYWSTGGTQLPLTRPSPRHVLRPRRTRRLLILHRQITSRSLNQSMGTCRGSN